MRAAEPPPRDGTTQMVFLLIAFVLPPIGFLAAIVDLMSDSKPRRSNGASLFVVAGFGAVVYAAVLSG